MRGKSNQTDCECKGGGFRVNATKVVGETKPTKQTTVTVKTTTAEPEDNRSWWQKVVDWFGSFALACSSHGGCDPPMRK